MSKTNKKIHKKTKITCKVILEKGPKKGQKCGKPCKKGNKCGSHQNGRPEYAKVICVTRRYNALLTKINGIKKQCADIVDVLRATREINNKKIYGIRIFLNDETLKKDDKYEYTPYNETHKHNALYRKMVLEKRNKVINDNIKDMKKYSENLGEMKELILEN